MEAIELLMSEHRVIERVLDSLEAYARAAARGGDPDPGRLSDHVRFLRGYADAIHHGKEEDILFAGLRQQGCPPDFAPVLEAIEREHETGRNLVDDLEAVARRPRPWSDADRERLQRAAGNFVSMLRKHIRDEDDAVFPQVRELLHDDTAERIEAASARFEATHEQERRALQDLADRLAGA